jgi:hypothetical protein
MILVELIGVFVVIAGLLLVSIYKLGDTLLSIIEILSNKEDPLADIFFVLNQKPLMWKSPQKGDSGDAMGSLALSGKPTLDKV